MNKITAYAFSIALFALIGVLNTARADDEARFGALRTKVAQLMAHEPDDVLTMIEKNWSTFTPCTDEPAAHLGAALMGIDGVSYRFWFLPTSADGTYTCVFMDKPFHRALSVDEARDFYAAYVLPDMPRSMADFTSAAELAARAKAGEKHLVELRAIVASGTASPLDPEDRTIKHPDIGNLDNLTDCSHESIAELDGRSSNSAADGQILYNDIYSWIDLNPDSTRCIYMVSPFKRGLTVAEAHDFLIALTLDLGMSDEFRRTHGLTDTPQSGLKAPASDGSAIEPAKKKSPSTSPPSPIGTPAPAGLTRLNDSTYPNNTVAVLQRPQGTGTVTAVQIGSNVYVTAAHNVIRSDNKALGRTDQQRTLGLQRRHPTLWKRHASGTRRHHVQLPNLRHRPFRWVYHDERAWPVVDFRIALVIAHRQGGNCNCSRRRFSA